MLSSYEIGSFADQQFHIESTWTKRQGIYVWVLTTSKGSRPVRIGIAWSGGFGGRHQLHNRWLSGDFHPDVPDEQAKRSLTLERLHNGDRVFAIEIPDRDLALGFETMTRQHYGSNLDLDPMAHGSWILPHDDGVAIRTPAIAKPRRTHRPAAALA